MKSTSIRSRIKRLEEKRGDTCCMLLTGKDAEPANVELLKREIIARGQKPWFLCMNFGEPPENDDHPNNDGQPDKIA